MAKIKRQKLVHVIGAQSRAVPAYISAMKRELLLSTGGPEALVTAVKTRTLQSSETAFSGEPVGKGLPYGPGHTPETLARAEAVLAAGRWDDTVGFVNDAASLGGVKYGVFIEDRDGNHAAAHANMPAAFKREAPGAWKAAMREAAA